MELLRTAACERPDIGRDPVGASGSVVILRPMREPGGQYGRIGAGCDVVSRCDGDVNRDDDDDDENHRPQASPSSYHQFARERLTLHPLKQSWRRMRHRVSGP